ncbi:MAG: response regulator [Anaerolineae bacterium]
MSENNGADPLTILIADDVQETRRSTRLMMSLISNVKVVAIAQNGRQAVELAREHHPDIAVMDVNMPHMDGLSAIANMLRIQPQLACVVVSAERDMETLRRAMALGVRAYLTKPFTSEELVEVMARVIQGIHATRQEPEMADFLRQERNVYLEELAHEYVKARRTDEKAMDVYEKLAIYPDCDIRFMRALAMIYVLRSEWRKLRLLTDKLEKRTENR